MLKKRIVKYYYNNIYYYIYNIHIIYIVKFISPLLVVLMRKLNTEF